MARPKEYSASEELATIHEVGTNTRVATDTGCTCAFDNGVDTECPIDVGTKRTTMTIGRMMTSVTATPITAMARSPKSVDVSCGRYGWGRNASCYPRVVQAGVAQLIERDRSEVDVASSSLVSRSLIRFRTRAESQCEPALGKAIPGETRRRRSVQRMANLRATAVNSVMRVAELFRWKGTVVAASYALKPGRPSGEHGSCLKAGAVHQSPVPHPRVSDQLSGQVGLTPGQEDKTRGSSKDGSTSFPNLVIAEMRRPDTVNTSTPLAWYRPVWGSRT